MEGLQMKVKDDRRERERNVQGGCTKKEKRQEGEERIVTISQEEANREQAKVGWYPPFPRQIRTGCDPREPSTHREDTPVPWEELTYPGSNALKRGDPPVVPHWPDEGP